MEFQHDLFTGWGILYKSIVTSINWIQKYLKHFENTDDNIIL